MRHLLSGTAVVVVVVVLVGQGLSLIKLDNKLTQLQLPLDAPLDGLW